MEILLFILGMLIGNFIVSIVTNFFKNRINSTNKDKKKSIKEFKNIYKLIKKYFVSYMKKIFINANIVTVTCLKLQYTAWLSGK